MIVVASAHGIFRGGLAVHLAMVAMAGELGVEVDLAAVPVHGVLEDQVLLYSESAGRFIVTVDPALQADFEKCFDKPSIGCIGRVTEAPRMIVRSCRGESIIDLLVPDLKKAWQQPFGKFNMNPIKALVLTGYGLNCDTETAYAFELAGAQAQRVHINSLIDGSVHLGNFHILAFIGGFSWGDDHGAGVVQAVRLKTCIGDELLSFIDMGRLVIGICNGFQCLVNLGLLPALNGDYACRSVALTHNDCGNFRNDWVHLTVDPSTSCIFTRGLEHIELPIRHGEGKFVTEQKTLKQLQDNRQIVLRYALPDGGAARSTFPHNPNGSMDDVAGICDPTGRVFGLMPHPEAFNHWTNHPNWTMLKEKIKRGQAQENKGLTPGIQILKNAVDFF